MANVKIIKYEKPYCAPCARVEGYLKDLGVADVVDHRNPFDDPDAAAKHGVMMSVPVVALVNADTDELIVSAEGDNRDGINVLVDMYHKLKQGA